MSGPPRPGIREVSVWPANSPWPRRCCGRPASEPMLPQAVDDVDPAARRDLRLRGAGGGDQRRAAFRCAHLPVTLDPAHASRSPMTDAGSRRPTDAGLDAGQRPAGTWPPGGRAWAARSRPGPRTRRRFLVRSTASVARVTTERAAASPPPAPTAHPGPARRRPGADPGRLRGTDRAGAGHAGGRPGRHRRRGRAGRPAHSTGCGAAGRADARHGRVVRRGVAGRPAAGLPGDHPDHLRPARLPAPGDGRRRPPDSWSRTPRPRC